MLFFFYLVLLFDYCYPLKLSEPGATAVIEKPQKRTRKRIRMREILQ